MESLALFVSSVPPCYRNLGQTLGSFSKEVNMGMDEQVLVQGLQRKRNKTLEYVKCRNNFKLKSRLLRVIQSFQTSMKPLPKSLNTSRNLTSRDFFLILKQMHKNAYNYI